MKETQNGYQPSKMNIEKPIPPNTGSNVKMKKYGYTWEEIDKAWWEGFDCCKNKFEKKIEELQEETEQTKKLIEDSRKDGISLINALIIKSLVEQIEKMKCCGNCEWLPMINETINDGTRYTKMSLLR